MKTCFANVLRHEAAKCFTNRWYVLALGICVAFGVVSALESWGYVRGVLVPFGDLTSNMSCFANGMIANCNASLAATIFFYTAPAIVCIPYAWSYHTERLSGYDAQVALRVPAGMRMAAKAMATFLSGCSLMAAALVVNAVLLACLLPAWVPIIEEWDILGIFYDSLFTGLFYTHPLAYLVAYGCMDACICGVWACFVASLSWATRNRSALLVLPYLLLLGWQYVTKQLVGIFDIIGFSVNIIDDMQGTFYVARSDFLSIAVQLAVLAGAAWLGWRTLAKREVL